MVAKLPMGKVQRIIEFIETLLGRNKCSKKRATPVTWAFKFCFKGDLAWEIICFIFEKPVNCC